MQGLEVLCQVGWLWWHNSSSQLLAFCILGVLGWQDWGCLQCTSKSLPCGVDCQGGLAAKWWGHGGHHLGVYGICYRQLAWCWHDPGQWAGQLGWSSLGRDVWMHGGNTLPPALVSALMWSKAVPLLLALGGSFTIVYASLHHGAQTSFTTVSSGWVSPMVPQSTASMNSSSHGGVSSVLTCTMSAFFPFPWHSWWEAFSAPWDLADCWPVAPELQHFACQWPFLEQPLQIEFCAGQLSWPGECGWVQLEHCGAHFCGFSSEFDSFGGRHRWFYWHTSQPLLTQWHIMSDWSPVDLIPFFMIDLEEFLPQFDISIRDGSNEPALNLELNGSIATIAHLCMACKLAYPIYEFINRFVRPLLDILQFIDVDSWEDLVI